MPVNLEFAVRPKASKRASLKRSALASLLAASYEPRFEILSGYLLRGPEAAGA